MFGLAPSLPPSYLASGNGCWAFIWVAVPPDRRTERPVRSSHCYSGFTIPRRFCSLAPNSLRSMRRELVVHSSPANTQCESRRKRNGEALACVDKTSKASRADEDSVKKGEIMGTILMIILILL